MKKRIISMVLAMLMFVSVIGTPAFATGEPENSADTQNELITVKDCYLAGEKWIRANYDNKTVISSVVPIKDLYDEINGYCINFSRDGQPAGYLILNAARNSTSYIREFAFSGKGIYDQLIENSNLNANLSTYIDTAIYSTNPFEYALKFTEAGRTKIYNSDTEVLTLDTARSVYVVTSSAYGARGTGARSSSNKEEYYDSFFNGTSLISFQAKNNVVIPGASSIKPYTMDELRTGTNQGNCGPTAATNLMALYYKNGKSNILVDSSDISKTYKALVTAVGFAANGTGGTTYSNLQSGIKSYVKGRSYKITINDYLFDTWENFKSDFDNHKANLIYIEGNKLDNGTWTSVGHFVLGVGYRIMLDGSRYVRIYDGWNAANDRFVLFDSESITEFKGASVTIS